jgi:hypothetical protein
MTKRNRAHDTLPMLGRPVPAVDATGPVNDATVPIARAPVDLTEPIGLTDATDPGPPPAFTEHRPLESITPVPTAEDVREAKAIIEGFKNRPLRPPAPRPKQQASSDGGDFVAYNTVGHPAPRTPEDAKQQALVEIARMASSPDPSAPGLAQRDILTYVATSRRRRRSLPQIAAGATVVVALAGVFLAVLTREHPAAAPPTAPPSAASAAISPPAPVPPQPPAPTPSTPPPQPSAPPAPAAAPTEPPTAKPASAASTRPVKPHPGSKEIVNW